MAANTMNGTTAISQTGHCETIAEPGPRRYTIIKYRSPFATQTQRSEISNLYSNLKNINREIPKMDH